MSHTTARRLGTLTLAGALALTAAACSSSGPTATDASAQGGNSSTVTINFGDQQQDLETLLQALRRARRAPATRSTSSSSTAGRWSTPGSPRTGSTSASWATCPPRWRSSPGCRSRPSPSQLPIGASEFLLAKPGITSIAQLRGKPVAYTTGTAEQAFALRALKRPGSPRRTSSRSTSACCSWARCWSPAPPTRRWSASSRRSTTSRPTPARWSWPRRHGHPAPATATSSATTAALANPAKRAAIDDLTQAADRGRQLGEVPPEPVGHRLLRRRRASDAGRGQADPRRGRHRRTTCRSPAPCRRAAERGRPDGQRRRGPTAYSVAPLFNPARKPSTTTRSSRRYRKMANIPTRYHIQRTVSPSPAGSAPRSPAWTSPQPLDAEDRRRSSSRRSTRGRSCSSGTSTSTTRRRSRSAASSAS